MTLSKACEILTSIIRSSITVPQPASMYPAEAEGLGQAGEACRRHVQHQEHGEAVHARRGL